MLIANGLLRVIVFKNGFEKRIGSNLLLLLVNQTIALISDRYGLKSKRR